MNFSFSDTLTTAPDVVYQEISGETVLLNLKTELYFGLNSMGTRVWECIQANSSTESIIKTLAEEFEESEDLIKSDVVNLIQKMDDFGLVLISPDSNV